MQGLDAMQSLTVARIERELMAEVSDLMRPYNVEPPDDGAPDRADMLVMQSFTNRMRQLRADPRFAARQSAHDEAVAERRAARMRQLDAERCRAAAGALPRAERARATLGEDCPSRGGAGETRGCTAAARGGTRARDFGAPGRECRRGE